MKLVYLIFNLFVFVFITSCVTESKFISSDYKGKKIKNSSLDIIRLQTPVSIWNMSDFIDDFGSDKAEDTISNLLYSEMLNTLKKVTYFQSVQLIDYNVKPDFELKTFKISTVDSVEMLVPKNLALTGYIESESEFVLLIDRMTTSRITQSHWEGQHKVTSENLQYSICYLVLDRKSNKIIMYGVARSSASILFALTRSNWINNFKELITDIFRGSPFRNL